MGFHLVKRESKENLAELLEAKRACAASGSRYRGRASRQQHAVMGNLCRSKNSHSIRRLGFEHGPDVFVSDVEVFPGLIHLAKIG